MWKRQKVVFQQRPQRQPRHSPAIWIQCSSSWRTSASRIPGKFPSPQLLRIEVLKRIPGIRKSRRKFIGWRMLPCESLSLNCCVKLSRPCSNLQDVPFVAAAWCCSVHQVLLLRFGPQRRLGGANEPGTVYIVWS